MLGFASVPPMLAKPGRKARYRGYGSALLKDEIFNRIPDRADQNIVVVNSDYASNEHGEYDYTLGVRVTRANRAPEGFVAKIIVPGEYAIIRSQAGPFLRWFPRCGSAFGR